MTYYYITSHDPDPHNFSCKRFIVDENSHWVCGNNEGSDAWDALVHKAGGEKEACKCLIDELYAFGDLDSGIKVEGVMINRVPDDEIETLFEEEW